MLLQETPRAKVGDVVEKVKLLVLSTKRRAKKLKGVREVREVKEEREEKAEAEEEAVADAEVAVEEPVVSPELGPTMPRSRRL
jgi:hypothetical protein